MSDSEKFLARNFYKDFLSFAEIKLFDAILNFFLNMKK